MKLLILTSIIGLAIVLLLVAYVWAEPVNHYNSITDMLEIATVPYENPANVSEAEANICYISQNVRAILEANREALERFKRVIRAEKQLAKGKADG